MDAATITALIAAIVSLVTAIGVLAKTTAAARNGHAETERLATDSAVAAFDKLCERLQERLEANEAELERAKREQDRLDKLVNAQGMELAEVKAENERLRQRVQELEEERVSLLRQIAALQRERLEA